MAEWLYTEATISALICEEVAFLRNACMSGKGELERIEKQRRDSKYEMLDETQGFAEIQASLKARTDEIYRLKGQLAILQSGQPAKVDRPLHTRQRRTLLAIIAALCTHDGIDYNARGAAQRIKSATELAGTPIDDGTIDKVLKENPDALAPRMK